MRVKCSATLPTSLQTTSAMGASGHEVRLPLCGGLRDDLGYPCSGRFDRSLFGRTARRAHLGNGRIEPLCAHRTDLAAAFFDVKAAARSHVLPYQHGFVGDKRNA